MLPDPLQHAGLSVQVVDGNVEEALDLTGVKIHGDDVVAAGSLKHVGHELGGDRRTTLVLLVLARIWEVGDDGRDAPRRGGLAGVDHDEQFHQPIVDVIGPRRLQDEDILISYTFTDCDTGFLVGVLEDHDLGQLNAEPVDPPQRVTR